MLEHINAARLATNFSPTRERREIYFAVNTGTPMTPEEQAEFNRMMAETATGEQIERHNTNRLSATQNIQDETQETRGAIDDVLNKPEALPSRSKRAEALREKNEDFRNLLKDVEKIAISKDVSAAAETMGASRELEESKALIYTEQEKVAQWESVLNIIGDWDRGSADPQIFLATMLDMHKHADGGPTEYAYALEMYMQGHKQDLAEYIPMENIDTIERGINNWKDHKSTPESFVSTIAMHAQNDPEMYTPILVELNNYVVAHGADIAMWNQTGEGQGLNESRKLEIIAEMNTIAQTDRILAQIAYARKIRKEVNGIIETDTILAGAANHLEERMKIFRKMEEVLSEEFPKALKDLAHGNHGHHQTLSQKLGIEWFTPAQVLGALKEIKESYMEAYHAWSHHKQAGLARSMGHMVEWAPFGERTQTYLEKRANSSDDKQKNEFKEYLEQLHPNFKQLFYGNDSLLNTEGQRDSNHARAILEYGASYGFLYDLDDSATKEDKTVLGHSLAHLMHDYDDKRLRDYYHSLRSQNASGRESNIKHGEERVHDIESPPEFIHELEHELHEVNIWEAVGIVKRAIDRGLWSEISPWILTTVTRNLRENQALREHMPVNALDKLGGLTFYRAGGWTAGFFKGKRKDIHKWLKTGKGIEDSGLVQGQTIYEIEQDIKHSTGEDFASHSDKADLDHLVAKVLTTMTLKGDVKMLSGKKVHFKTPVTIFADKYKEYRTGGHISGQGNTAPGIDKEDPDYYTTPGDNLLSGAIPVSEILAPTGGGKFQNEAFAQNYIGSILKVYRGLKEDGLSGEARAFRKEMGRKLTTHFTMVLRDARTTGLPTYNTMEMNSETDELALLTLIKEGFLPIDPFVHTFWAASENSGIGMAKDILRQIDPKLYSAIEKAKADAKDKTDETPAFTILNKWKAENQGKNGFDFPSIEDVTYINSPEIVKKKKGEEADSYSMSA